MHSYISHHPALSLVGVRKGLDNDNIWSWVDCNPSASQLRWTQTVEGYVRFSTIIRYEISSTVEDRIMDLIISGVTSLLCLMGAYLIKATTNWGRSSRFTLRSTLCIPKVVLIFFVLYTDQNQIQHSRWCLMLGCNVRTHFISCLEAHLELRTRKAYLSWWMMIPIVAWVHCVINNDLDSQVDLGCI